MGHTIKIVIATVLILSAISFGGTYSGGSGIETEPYQISNVADWQELMNTPDDWASHFVLTADIDLAGITLTPVGIEGSTYFTGTFDGNGYIISNAVINQPSGYVGLFGRVGGGEIRNLGVEDVNITGSYCVGGLAGGNSGSLTGCYATGSVSGESNVGGLVGYNDYYGSLTSCYATGTVTGTDDAGGLAGSNSSGTLTSCYATGLVSGTGYYVGGLVGSGWGYITACFWDMETSGQSGSRGGKGLTTSQMKSIIIYQNAGWADKGWVINDGLDYPRLAWENTGGVPIPQQLPIPLSGSGSEEDPYQIHTAEEFALLNWYSDALSKHIALMADLNLSTVTVSPLGDFLGTPFTGTFEGNRHIISNLTIITPTQNYVGLFSRVSEGGQIRNLGVENANITGSSSVGGLAGGNDGGYISACYVTGSVSGECDVGGLVGECYSGSLTGCYAACSVTGDSSVGGLAGVNEQYSISGCYSTGSVSGSESVGGLVGVGWDGVLTNCYATCLVTGEYSVGGLAGGEEEGTNTIISCFWDTQTSGQSTSKNGGIGLPTIIMQDSEIYLRAFWDFKGEIRNGTVDTWAMPQGGGYPILAWQLGGSSVSNDDMGNATAVTTGSAVSGTSIGATGLDITRNGYNDSADVWYYFDCAGTGKYTVTVTPNGFNGTLGVFDTAQREIIFNDDFFGEKSVVILNASAGRRYYIRVAGYDGQTGNFTLTIAQGAVQAIQGDLNYDGIVNLSDFAVFAGQWLEGI